MIDTTEAEVAESIDSPRATASRIALLDTSTGLIVTFNTCASRRNPGAVLL